jgi:hypothetical protein
MLPRIIVIFPADDAEGVKNKAVFFPPCAHCVQRERETEVCEKTLHPLTQQQIRFLHKSH